MLLCNKTLLEGQVCNSSNAIYFVYSTSNILSFFRYKRIFSIGTHGITTYNPNSLEITNRYSYNQIISIQVDPQNAGGFVLSVRDKNKLDKFKFSTDFRSNLLTDALKFRHQFSERGQEELYVSNIIIIASLKI